MPPLTRNELRLAGFCRALSGLSFTGAVLFAAAPRLSYRIASFGNLAEASAESRFWSVLAASLFVATGTALALVAPRPRERRHAMLPVLAALSASLALAFLQILQIGADNALVALGLMSVTLFALTAAVYRAAAPGVAAAHRSTQPAASPQGDGPSDSPTIQLGVGIQKQA